jgi:hypothetical protein
VLVNTRLISISLFALFCGAACSSDPNRPNTPPRVEALSEGTATAPEPKAPARLEGVDAPYREVALDSNGKLPGSGTLEVTATWNHLPPAAVTSPGPNACGIPARPPLGFVVIGKGESAHALLYAVIGLERVGEGRPLGRAEAVEVVISQCQLSPPVMVAARVGAPLRVTNLDERRHEILVEELGNGAEVPRVLAHLPMSVVGQRFELPLTRPGLYRVSSSSGRDSPVYVAVSTHPYAAVPNGRGVTLLEQVPAGRYQVWAWHPPLDHAGTAIVARASAVVESEKTTTLSVPLDDSIH